MSNGGARPLHVTVPGAPERRFTGRIRVGRNPDCDVVLADRMVSWEHCVVEVRDGRWIVDDPGSRNGTFVGPERVRVLPLPAGQPVVLRLGDPATGPAVGLRAADEQEPPTVLAPFPLGDHPAPRPDDIAAVHRLDAGPVTIGRVPGNTVVVDDLLVSRHHAAVRIVEPGRAEVTDLGSRNGVFVNGHPVGRAWLRPLDRLTIGRRTFSYDGAWALREHGTAGQAALSAEHLSVDIDGKSVLSDVTFAVEPGTFLAIIGPSGAGKSTLLRALTGIRAADDGRVLVDGIDLYPAYDEVRHRIGLVPQEDVLHEQLKVDQALRYAAALRLPDDVPAEARQQRVDSVLAQLDLGAQRGLAISRLSGGQRKRASVAMELLTEPSLLYLDEPTSGLDPLLDREVMRGLRQLADRRRTVVVVTHSTLYLHLCHRILVLARGGRVAYFGPPDKLLAHFRAADYADVFTALSDDATGWAHRFAAEAQPARPPVRQTPVAPPLPPRQSWRRQFGLLLHRAAALAGADRRHLALLLGLPLVLAAVVQTVPGSAGLAPAEPGTISTGAGMLLVILVIGAAFMGMASSVRELVAERPIYHREWAVGLRPATYLGAKLTTNALVCLLQAVLLTTLGLLGRRTPEYGLLLSSPRVELVLVLALTAFAASAAGLLASALVARTEHTMPILVIAVMAQLVLSGGLFSIADRVGLQAVAVLSPTRWGYAASAATVDLRGIQTTAPADALWRHEPGTWLFCMAMLGVLAAAYAALALLALRAREQRPPRSRRARARD
jgi:ABC-type multidrug transport system ATPase subunit/pSer/pThr/pTyr-binding forkhead associated (FHA) protein